MGRTCSTRKLLMVWVILYYYHSMSSTSYGYGETSDSSSRVRAVNLGGWLVAEGWIKPDLFDVIPNKDFLDGTGLQFKSATIGKYLCPEEGGGSILAVNRTSASGWETFHLWRINETSFHMRVFNKQFVGLASARNGSGVVVVATSNTPGMSETFGFVRNPHNSSLDRIKASNGFFLRVKSEVLITADHSGGDEGWGDDDPSVFEMTFAGKLRGEFQLTNGYGPEKAPQVLRKHWSTFIVEEDFKFVAENGINAVRVPVGWWTASGETPPPPYVGGSLQALDNAFSWASKYGLKVIIDLHAVPESQNGWEHSASRDGSQQWGQTDASINRTVAIIDFFTARYAKCPSLYAVELINEPRSPGVSLANLTNYYSAGYAAVRRHSSAAYVVFSNRVGPSVDPRELFPLTSSLPRAVIDLHYYNLFSNVFNNMTVQQNLDFVRINRSADLGLVTTSNGPLTFVGEWTAEWQVKGAGKEDYQKFGKAQLEGYGRATFGWAYWTLKNVNNHWSLEWMIINGYIKLI